jgi:glycosyltransferase involved in cell wall biosynthesis
MIKNDILLSIIVPIYNGEKYIHRFFEVLDSQHVLSVSNNVADVEVIVVNDGSTDATASMIKDYQRKYDNIQCITQSNAGIAIARNAALEVARGEYIYFIDVDDLLVPNSIIPLTNVIKETGADILHFKPKSVSPSNAEIWKALQLGEIKIEATVTGILGLELYRDYIPCGIGVWFHIYSSKLLREHNGRFMQERIWNEDSIFNLKMYLAAKKIVMVENLAYLYVQNSDSIVHTKDINRRAPLSHNGYLLADVFNSVSKEIYDKYPNHRGLARVLKEMSISWVFLNFSFILRYGLIDYKRAFSILDECIKRGTYPIGHKLPTLSVGNSLTYRVLFYLISWKPILKLMLYLRLLMRK